MARAERPRGTCSVCGKDCAITDEGGVRHHFTEDPDQQAGPDSRKCRGVGQPPAGAAPAAGDIRFLCRVPSGPTGCGHAVQLTANHRARSHLTPHGEKCAEGGSAFPIAVGPDGFRQDTAEWTEADWDRALPRPVRGGEILQAVAPEDLRIETDRDFDPRPDPHAREADIAIAEAERIQREQDADYEQALQDGLEESRRKAEAEEIARIKTLPPEERAAPADALFDPTHTVTTDLGPEVHPGKAGDCREPGCCTHPRGFEYGDDGNGHSGSFCPVCGTEEPEPGPADWHCPPNILERMPEDVQALARTNPECWDCGHEVTPLADRFEPDGSVKKVVWTCSQGCRWTTDGHRPCRPQLPCQQRIDDTAEGVLFVRHTAKPPLNKLVYRAGAPDSRGHLTATVVTAGPYAGRTGTLTNLDEEITCTDLHGTPRPRRTPVGPPTSPDLYPTPSRPAPTTPGRTPDRSSRPSGPGSARSSSAGTSSSTPATSSGPSGAASTSTRTATRSGSVADAFSTPKQAASESDKYDRYGRYKLLHPDTGKKVQWTRATTFAKSVQDTFALSMWSQRMTLKGAALRPDIVAAVATLDVKDDKDRVNSLVEDAKKAAGDKVAANLGTAVHAFTEDRDKALVGLPVKPREVPEKLVPTVDAYEALLASFGLEPVPGLIEFTTAVRQYEVAGTSDRVYRVMRNITFKLNSRTVTLYAGEYVIGDVKTGADLSYGWQEICIQLALYAQGLNTSGVWDWNTGRWSRPVTVESTDVQLKVRTDVGLVPHLPVDRPDGAPLATLFAVDLDAGWAATVLCGQVRTWRRERTLATALEVADVADAREYGNVETGVTGPVYDSLVKAAQRPVSRPVVASRPATLEEKARAVTSRAEASQVWQEATAARVSGAELKRLTGIMQEKLASFVEQGA
jgi:hypothetical protein